MNFDHFVQFILNCSFDKFHVCFCWVHLTHCDCSMFILLLDFDTLEVERKNTIESYDKTCISSVASFFVDLCEQ